MEIGGHPIPRQITTFEFKLIGFLTLRQFIYLVVFFPLGFIVYALFPIPLLNIFAGISVAGMGLVLAFVPINDRPLEVWIKNLIKRLTSPTQYTYHKENKPLYFLDDLYFVSDPHRVISHIESQEKLNLYLFQTKKNPTQTSSQKKQITNKLFFGQKNTGKKQATKTQTQNQVVQNQTVTQTRKTTPFFTGVVKNNKQIPLPGILLYVKNEKGTVLRLLKTNPYGIFATFNPLPAGEYFFEIKDPKGGFFFDTMKIRIENENKKPIEIYSKEMI
ncbi:MAG: PrgI family protein [Patescibacteria group bacterium]|nr:PrgI family protein [Patescibacteria group bacterium]